MAAPVTGGTPRRVLGFTDVLLFFVTAGTNLQWVAAAAAAGPSGLTVWIIGCAAMFIPLSVCVVDLSWRLPDEGGLYVWSKRAFGPFAGFITGWTYWSSNLPYFPSLLYFTAGNALFITTHGWQALSGTSTYFIVVSVAGLACATALNVMGLEVGKWLNNIGAITRWLTTLILISLGGVAWWTFGSATAITSASLRPSMHLKDLLFWSTIAFAWTGPEAASFMGGEIRDPRRTIGRALAAAAPMIGAIYLLGTTSVLVALPIGEVSGLYGVLQAISRVETRLGWSGIAPLAAVLMTITCLGSVGAWLGAMARIPFAAGLDHFLPESFSRLHPRWGSPYVALITQSAIASVFVLLGQAGTTVKGAYDVLVSMLIIITFIPFLFVFAAAIKLQKTPAPPGGFQIPGGKATIVVLAALGFVTTVGALFLSVIPSSDDPHPWLAVSKVVLITMFVVGSGVAVYVLGGRRAARSSPADNSGHLTEARSSDLGSGDHTT